MLQVTKYQELMPDPFDDVAKSRSGISIRIIIFAASAELLGEAHFNKALIRDIFSIGLLLDAPEQRDWHTQRNRLCGKFQIRHRNPDRLGQIQMVGA